MDVWGSGLAATTWNSASGGATSVLRPGSSPDAEGGSFAAILGSLNAESAGGNELRNVSSVGSATASVEGGPLPGVNTRLSDGSINHDGDLREAFDDFVGQTLFGQLMSTMRKSISENPYFGGGPGQAAFQQQLDQVLVEKISDSAGASVSEPMWRLFSGRT